jgi:hypothetical protein
MCTPEERRQIYGMLRLEVQVDADGSMEARGVLSNDLAGAGKRGQLLVKRYQHQDATPEIQNSLSCDLGPFWTMVSVMFASSG